MKTIVVRLAVLAILGVLIKPAVPMPAQTFQPDGSIPAPPYCPPGAVCD